MEGTAYKDGSFDLTYKFYYRDSDNDPQTYTLRFDYDAKGKLTGEPGIVDHSSFWPPFNAIKIAGAVADELSKELNK